MRPRLVAVSVLALWACPREVPLAAGVPRGAAATPAPDGGAPRADLDPHVADARAVLDELAASLRDTDEALWAHWTTGVPLGLEALRARHPRLLRPEAVLTVRQARAVLPSEARALQHAEVALAGAQLTRAVAEQETALANLEASLTFPVEGREVRWRELQRLLANEPSAVKRKALWTGSLAAARRLSALVATRDAALQDAQRALALEPDAWLEARRDLDLDALGEVADRVLADTGPAWTAVLVRRASVELKLPRERIHRGDLPRLMKPAPGLDAALPADGQARAAQQALERLGLLPAPGLRLALDAASVKGPLPLTVVAGPQDVRVAVRPQAGLHGLAALLGELGRAVALHAGSSQRFEYARLGAPALADAAAALFGGLVAEPRFLEDLGLSPEVAAAAAQSWSDAQLLQARRAAGATLSALATRLLPPPEAVEAWRQQTARAVGVPLQPDADVRFRVELDPELASADVLRAHLGAAWLREQLIAQAGETWWRAPEAGALLKALWSSGTAAPPDARLCTLVDGAAAFARRYPAPAPPPADGGSWTPVPAPEPRALADAGTWTPVAWPQPKALADAPAGGPAARPWGTAVPFPAPKTLADAGAPAPAADAGR